MKVEKRPKIRDTGKTIYLDFGDFEIGTDIYYIIDVKYDADTDSKTITFENFELENIKYIGETAEVGTEVIEDIIKEYLKEIIKG